MTSQNGHRVKLLVLLLNPAPSGQASLARLFFTFTTAFQESKAEVLEQLQPTQRQQERLKTHV